MVEIESRLPVAVSPGIEEIEEARPMGLLRINKMTVSEISRLGISLEKEGVVKFADGMAAFTSVHVAAVVQKLTEKLEDPETTTDEVHAIAKSLAGLARSVSQIAGTMKKTAVASHAPTQPRMSFPANAKVTFVNHQTVVQANTNDKSEAKPDPAVPVQAPGA